VQGVASPERRVELFAAYIEALRQVAAQRIAKAEAAVTQLLVKLNVGPESSWDEVSSKQVVGAAGQHYNHPLRRRVGYHLQRTNHGIRGL
jgi:hypothetical protein